MTDSTSKILRQRRMELGLSQLQVALDAGVPVREYQRFEYGERKVETCSLRLGLRLCQVLKLDPYDLVRETN